MILQFYLWSYVNCMLAIHFNLIFFFFNDTATTEIYTLSLHDALPIWPNILGGERTIHVLEPQRGQGPVVPEDRKSTRLNSSHANISYAVFCLKKKNNPKILLSLSIKYLQTSIVLVSHN